MDKYVIEYKDGSKYEGEFKDEKKHGHGKLVMPNNDIYNGEWFEDKANGRGICTCADGRIYNGDWKDNGACGYGIMTYNNGDTYYGEFKEGKPHGYGFIGDDKSGYEGGWKNGEWHGRGIYKFKDGQSIQGEWKDGIAIRTVVFCPDGKISLLKYNGTTYDSIDNYEPTENDIFKPDIRFSSLAIFKTFIAINDIVKENGVDCFKKDGKAINYLADYLPEKEFTKTRRRVKNAIDSGACDFLIESNTNKEERICGAVSKLIDYCDMDEKIANKTINLLATVLI